jgi:hypothetical protein
MPADEDVVLTITNVGQEAIANKVDELTAAGTPVTGDDVISVYLTMCRHAVVMAKRHGVKAQVLIDPLQLIILELSEPKGKVS